MAEAKAKNRRLSHKTRRDLADFGKTGILWVNLSSNWANVAGAIDVSSLNRVFQQRKEKLD
ncbi:hypothetical protein KEF85_00490 [Methylomonas paludis]|uniref:Uncharacterized protein n=1 Tax=Methylomonas paludis TaxID=1173101 RepID=A0A975RA67_9GAMM|nr:hypothetical protein [Methylomonas paludis]QWF71013.1 hypothetical protein KEF85_00490 [Methylomonas paludis]